jgi:hypothetical protein
MSSGSLVALSCLPSAMLSPALSYASSIVQSSVPLSVPFTCKLSQIESGSNSDSNISKLSHEPDDLKPREEAEDSENNNMNNFMDANEAKLNVKENICDWHKL